MEHQDSVTWPFYGVIAAYCVVVVGCSIYLGEVQVLLYGVGMLLVGMAGWGMLALLNFIMFPPLFRMLGRLTGKQGGRESSDSHDHRA